MEQWQPGPSLQNHRLIHLHSFLTEQCIVWEMNAELHAKEAWVYEMDRQRRGIKDASCPPESPDRNQIEPLWDYQDTVMERFKVNGSNKREIDRLKGLWRME